MYIYVYGYRYFIIGSSVVEREEKTVAGIPRIFLHQKSQNGLSNLTAEFSFAVKEVKNKGERWE